MILVDILPYSRYRVLLEMNRPTLTAVFESSSDARLPPGRLLVLRRLALRAGLIMALIGRGGICEGTGDAGGEGIVMLALRERCSTRRKGVLWMIPSFVKVHQI